MVSVPVAFLVIWYFSVTDKSDCAALERAAYEEQFVLEGGEFEYWPEGFDRPSRTERPPYSNSCVIADNEYMYHRVGATGTPAEYWAEDSVPYGALLHLTDFITLCFKTGCLKTGCFNAPQFCGRITGCNITGRGDQRGS